jgi:hypothetical protein
MRKDKMKRILLNLFWILIIVIILELLIHLLGQGVIIGILAFLLLKAFS